MGIHSMIKNRKKQHVTKGVKRRNKQLNSKSKKDAKAVVLEGMELLSKDQLKKVAKNPTNNIRPSGKRKRKMMKRLKHSQREKNTMEVEASPGPSKSTPSANSSKSVEVASDTEQMEEDTT